MEASPRATVVGIVTPHLLRVVDLANQAEKGLTVDGHLRELVGKSMAELGELYNAPVAITAYVEGLERAASEAPRMRAAYVGTLRAAADAARRLRRD